MNGKIDRAIDHWWKLQFENVIFMHMQMQVHKQKEKEKEKEK